MEDTAGAGRTERVRPGRAAPEASTSGAGPIGDIAVIEDWVATDVERDIGLTAGSPTRMDEPDVK